MSSIFRERGIQRTNPWESWSETLRSLKSRGMNCPRLVVGGGGYLGIWGVL